MLAYEIWSDFIDLKLFFVVIVQVHFVDKFAFLKSEKFKLSFTRHSEKVNILQFTFYLEPEGVF